MTAEWVAASRMLGERLPERARLVVDPYAASFLGPVASFMVRHAGALVRLPLLPLTLHMQVRTRVIDDALRAFVGDGGRQVVILGAGYDCRAARFAEELREGRVFEVDHPATQANKRAALARVQARSAPVRYVAWDFEARPPVELPPALAAAGHDPSLPTLTIWEGVTMYLTEPAIEGSVAAVRALSAPGSPFVLTYFDRARLERPGAAGAIMSRFVALRGEPFRFGWPRAELPAWLSARGFDVEDNRAMLDLARALLPPMYARMVGDHDSAIAIARRADRTGS